MVATGKRGGSVAVVAAAIGHADGGTAGAAVGVEAGTEQRDLDAMIGGEAELGIMTGSLTGSQPRRGGELVT